MPEKPEKIWIKKQEVPLKAGIQCEGRERRCGGKIQATRSSTLRVGLLTRNVKDVKHS